MFHEKFTFWIIATLIAAIIVLICLEVAPSANEIASVPMLTRTNFDLVEPLDIWGISLPSRKKSHFQHLEKVLKSQGLVLNYFEAINGKTVDFSKLNLTPRYRAFFENNIKERLEGKTAIDYRGHMGATLSHLQVVKSVQRMTLICEDDADLVPGFRQKLEKFLVDVTEVDPQWEVLVLGFSARYSDYHYHKLNDSEPLHKGYICHLHAFIGCWAWLIRSPAVAAKIVKLFEPAMPWHVDLVISDAFRMGVLRAYSCIPTIALHPGLLRISSFNHTQVGNVTLIKTDTNA